MGGRGSSSGRGGGQSPILKGDPETITTVYYRNATYGESPYKNEVLDAKYDINTNELKVSYAADKEFHDSAPSNKQVFVDITVQNGFIDGKPVNLNLDSPNLKSISGIGSPKYETAGMTKTLRSHGFEYKSSDKKWVKGYEGFTKSGSTVTIDNGFPKNLSGISTIKGNTYDYKREIKAAGFKWDGNTKEWKKK